MLGIIRQDELAGKHDGKHGDRMPSFLLVADHFSDGSHSSMEEDDVEEEEGRGGLPKRRLHRRGGRPACGGKGAVG
jgi:hypothetical protein